MTQRSPSVEMTVAQVLNTIGIIFHLAADVRVYYQRIIERQCTILQ